MTTAAVSVSKYVSFFRKKRVRSVLDYGAGTLRNARYLAEAGFEVYAADLPAQVERIMEMTGRSQLAGVLATDELEGSRLAVDLVVSIYVLNIIEDGSEVGKYLKNIVLNLRPEGYLLIEARCRRQSDHCGHGCSTSHRCHSCVKTFSHHELDLLLKPYGFRRISHYYRRHAVAVLYQAGKS